MAGKCNESLSFSTGRVSEKVQALAAKLICLLVKMLRVFVFIMNMLNFQYFNGGIDNKNC